MSWILTSLERECFKKVFPSSDEYYDSCKDVVEDFGDQFPLSFNVINLNAFKNTWHELKARQLFAVAASFQKNVVTSWNPNSSPPTSSIYLGLIAVDKADSKNCGAITLDICLRAGILE